MKKLFLAAMLVSVGAINSMESEVSNLVEILKSCDEDIACWRVGGDFVENEILQMLDSRRKLEDLSTENKKILTVDMKREFGDLFAENKKILTILKTVNAKVKEEINRLEQAN